MDTRPIGVFDSGVGGLTVAKEIMALLPNEKVIYFGDTARVPYGSKSKTTIVRYSQQIVRFLLTEDVKAIVIACNTANSYALEEVKEMFSIPIIGVALPGAEMAVNATQNYKIGVIGTEGTIKSEIYSKLINQINPGAEVIGKACPLFVPLVEEGLINDSVTEEIARRYLDDFKQKPVDTVVLGCTHYPLIEDVIQKIMGDKVYLVNPAFETAKNLKDLLIKNNIENSEINTNHHHYFYVSDRAEKFEEFAKIILNYPMMPVKQINIEDY
ncbi:glutamate racemase [Natranaerovirga pectinivora]|uniref:Glutamate racemase n=1 Tax=Natranaerovirga pectinivora TaxID=682400 RepID=A0A4R3MIX9_9FIRM|nr:glutamate racemase [Natranaerovirga pectinivora]TCT13963.1 glutamate racemase [Natranaerovirga pectinivora]